MEEIKQGIHVELYDFRPQGSTPSSTSGHVLVITGEDARCVYHTFKFANEAGRHNLDTLIETFHAHSKSTVKQTYRELVFIMQNRKPRENFDNSLMELRCNFRPMQNNMLRSRIILGTLNKQLQQKLVNKGLSLDKVIQQRRTAKKKAGLFRGIHSAKAAIVTADVCTL